MVSVVQRILNNLFIHIFLGDGQHNHFQDRQLSYRTQLSSFNNLVIDLHYVSNHSIVLCRLLLRFEKGIEIANFLFE